MANYYAASRTNYFEVKDIEAFQEDMAQYEVEVRQKHDTELFCILAQDHGSGCFPCYNNETDESFSFEEKIAPHLKDGWVGIIMEAGAEKMRYIHGHAVAFNNQGEERFIYLSEIQKLAMELGEYVTETQY